MNRTFDFLSGECKAGNHDRCAGRWAGLGIEVICNCNCKHRKKENKLGAEIIGALAPNSDTSLLEGIQHESQ